MLNPDAISETREAAREDRHYPPDVEIVGENELGQKGEISRSHDNIMASPIGFTGCPSLGSASI